MIPTALVHRSLSVNVTIQLKSIVSPEILLLVNSYEPFPVGRWLVRIEFKILVNSLLVGSRFSFLEF
jgi:hypothetical protein